MIQTSCGISDCGEGAPTQNFIGMYQCVITACHYLYLYDHKATEDPVTLCISHRFQPIFYFWKLPNMFSLCLFSLYFSFKRPSVENPHWCSRQDFDFLYFYTRRWLLTEVPLFFPKINPSFPLPLGMSFPLPGSLTSDTDRKNCALKTREEEETPQSAFNPIPQWY